MSPFGGPAQWVKAVPTGFIRELYIRKCGVDPAAQLAGLDEISLYRCEKTGYLFWHPRSIAGDEAFYQLLSAAWPDYYRRERWEYAIARRYLKNAGSLLEVGCGPGQFLRSVEETVHTAVGIELNSEAISSRVTRFEIRSQPLDAVAREQPASFNAVCAFQVLEHIADPASFLADAIACLRPGGLLIASTPNHRYVPHRDMQDAFDVPPHHMGHFDDGIFRRIAAHLNLEVVDLLHQPRRAGLEDASERASHGVINRLLRAAAREAIAWNYRRSAEPGPNMLAVLRKPAMPS